MFIGLDLGGNCGFALLNSHGACTNSGTMISANRSPISYYSLYNNIRSMVQRYLPLALAYETVTFGARYKGGNTRAMQAFGAYECMVWMAAAECCIPIVSVNVKTLKKFSTGFGDADKDEMLGAALNKWKFLPDTDDEADALFIAEYARVEHNKHVAANPGVEFKGNVK